MGTAPCSPAMSLSSGSNEIQFRFRDHQFAETEAGGIINSMLPGRFILYIGEKEAS